MILIKTENEINNMRRAGQKLARLLDDLLPAFLKEGVTGDQVDKFVSEYIEKEGGTASFKGYGGFPYTICYSLNEEVIHGFPVKNKVLKSGDLISVDIGFTYQGYVADAARTYGIGQLSVTDKKLLEVTEKSLYLAIEQAIIGNRVGDISNAVQTYVEQQGFSVIRDFVGHGVGRKVHEDPQVPNFGPAGVGPKLRKHMTLAIEPMVSVGGYDVVVENDDWTVTTLDRSKSAHFEHDIVITENGPEILTRLK